MRSTNTILLPVLFLSLLGFISSCKNSGTKRYNGNIKIYTLSSKKAETEQRLYDLFKKHPSLYSMKDPNRDPTDKWFFVFIHTPEQTDTSLAIFQFAGDSTTWNSQDESKILVFSVEKRSPSTMGFQQQTSDQTIKEQLQFFEKMVIDSLKTAPH
jgi:hypothetical protein